MFVWAPIPEPYREMGSLEFSKYLVTEAEVATSPGVGFGQGRRGVRALRPDRERAAHPAGRPQPAPGPDQARLKPPLPGAPSPTPGAAALLGSRRRRRSVRPWPTGWSRSILTPVLRVIFRVRSRGHGQRAATRDPAILASNHQSFIDSVFLPLVVRRRVTFVAKAEYFESWKTAWFFRAVGMIPLKRDGGSGIGAGPGRGPGGAGGGRGARHLPGGHPLARRPAVQGPHRRGPSVHPVRGSRRPGGPVRHRRGAAHRGHVAQAVPPGRGPELGPPLRWEGGGDGADRVCGSSPTRSWPRSPRCPARSMVDRYATRDRGRLSAPGSEAEPCRPRAPDAGRAG